MIILPFGLIGLGFLSGVRHAFDADHIAAVSTIVSRQKSIAKSAITGAFWGIGHGIALLAVGFFVILFKARIPEKITLMLEAAVGIMLILLGINVILTMKKSMIHFHRHMHGNFKHVHFHSHKLEKHHNHKHSSMLVGFIHGLAGSAALALIALATISSAWIGLLYILLFSMGSIAGMVLVTSAISLPFAMIPKRLEKIETSLKLSTAIASIIIGFFIII